MKSHWEQRNDDQEWGQSHTLTDRHGAFILALGRSELARYTWYEFDLCELRKI